MFRVAEAGVVDQDDENVRGALRRLRTRDHAPVRYRSLQRPTGRATEGPVRDRQPGAIRVELPHRGRQGLLKVFQSRATQCGHGLQQRAGQRLLDRQSARLLQHHDDHCRAGSKRLADLLLQAALHPLIDELRGQRPRPCPHGDRCQQHRRGEQPHSQADSGAPPHPVAPQFVAGVLEHRVAVGVLGHQDRSLDLDLLGLDLTDERVEVGVGDVQILVAGNEHTARVFTHGELPSRTDGVGSWPRPAWVATRTNKPEVQRDITHCNVARGCVTSPDR